MGAWCSTPGPMTDDLVARFRALDEEVAALAAASSRLKAQRRQILLELRATGMNMQQLADAVGLTRTRVYRIIGEIPDPRKGPPTAET